jgi:transposase-like protein
LIKELVEAALEAEIESHIANEVLEGKKNAKTLTTEKQSNQQSGNLNL